MKFSKALLFLTILIWLSGCRLFGLVDKPNKPEDGFINTFDKLPTKANLSPSLPEISGIADSRNFKQHVWVQEDGNSEDAIYLYDYNGKRQGKVMVPVKNYDWEDMVVANGPVDGQSYIYIANTGDNFSNRPTYSIIRFPEPKSINGQPLVNVENIEFKYPSGENPDAEAIIVSPQTKDIYIFTKNTRNCSIYKIAYQANYEGKVQTANFLKTVPFPLITSAGISTDGKEIVLKNYAFIYYWNTLAGEAIETTLGKSPTKYLPYESEPQGEAFCFTHDGKSYFTISEYDGNAPAILKRYDRTKE
jgi:hypothetical protein